jgi:hypothetical protein
MEGENKRRPERMEYTQRFTLKQERMKNNYPIVWTLIRGFYWSLTLAYPNSLGTKRLCCCGSVEMQI